MKLLNKKSIKNVVAFMLTIVLFALPVAVFGQDFGTSYLGGTDLPNDDLRTVLVRLINILLGVLGIIFLILVLIGGFMWMTAGGQEEQAKKGRQIIINGVLGLIIIFLSFAIVTFVFNILEQASV